MENGKNKSELARKRGVAEKRIYVCVSSSVSNFKEKILKNWPVKEYHYPQDIDEPTCFVGMYHLGDYQAFLNHKGKKMIFWCGSDILNLDNIIVSRNELSKVKNVCENEIERDKLLEYGISAEIHPTFAGNVNDYPKCYKDKFPTDVWLCVRKGREEEYGMEAVDCILLSPMNFIFHIYGIKGKNEKNKIFHGEVSEEQLDKEIRNYQIAARFNKFDGFSEVVAKGILLGQEVWSWIDYPKLNDRDYWVKKLTDFSWLKI